MNYIVLGGALAVVALLLLVIEARLGRRVIAGTVRAKLDIVCSEASFLIWRLRHVRPRHHLRTSGRTGVRAGAGMRERLQRMLRRASMTATHAPAVVSDSKLGQVMQDRRANTLSAAKKRKLKRDSLTGRR